MSALPPIVELIPHRPPMLLVDEVVRHEGLRVVCRTRIREDMPFVREGRVSVLLAVELFAQSACTLIALLASHGGRSMQSGALLGSREVRFHTDWLHVGDELSIRCEERFAIGTAAQIECVLCREDETLAEGSINVMAGDPDGAPEMPGASS